MWPSIGLEEFFLAHEPSECQSLAASKHLVMVVDVIVHVTCDNGYGKKRSGGHTKSTHMILMEHPRVFPDSEHTHISHRDSSIHRASQVDLATIFCHGWSLALHLQLSTEVEELLQEFQTQGLEGSNDSHRKLPGASCQNYFDLTLWKSPHMSTLTSDNTDFLKPILTETDFFFSFQTVGLNPE